MLAAGAANRPLGANQFKEGRLIDPPSPPITNQAAADMLKVGEASVKRARRTCPAQPVIATAQLSYLNDTLTLVR